MIVRRHLPLAKTHCFKRILEEAPQFAASPQDAGDPVKNHDHLAVVMPAEVYHGGDRGKPGNDACCIEQSMTIASRGHQGITGVLSFLSILWVRSDNGSQRRNFSMEGQGLPRDSILR